MSERFDVPLQVTDLRKEFRVRGRRDATLTAVDGISFELRAGQTTGLVGESGSGKSTVARCITRLIEPTAGEVRLCGRSLRELSARALRSAYGDLQMVFQDPRSSLNPRMTVRATLEEPLRLHGNLDRAGRLLRVRELLDDVRLPAEIAGRYPNQLSGGQRQRVSIARALAVDPRVIIFDEPTASLDVSVRRAILELLLRLQAEHDLAYLFISHDLETVRHIADRVLVMYLGSVVEEGTVAEVFGDPKHPYTRALWSSALSPTYGKRAERIRLSGDIPSPIDLPTGCPLASRCPFVEPACTVAKPPLVPVSASHVVACPVTLARSRSAENGGSDLSEHHVTIDPAPAPVGPPANSQE